jgi:hypothetical protein
MKTKSIQFLLFLSLFTFFINVQLFSTPDKVKGVWLSSSSLSLTNIDTVVTKLYDYSIEQAYLLVKGTDGVMIDSAILANFITAAHSKNIEVHCWYAVSQDAVFFAANPDAVIYHCPNPTSNPPNNVPYPMTGDASSRLNFLYPGYKEYVLGKLTWLLNNFDIDGIHLDNIRYHHLVYSFDQYHIARANALGCDTGRLLQLFLDNYASYSGAGWIGLYNQGDADVVKWVNMRTGVLLEFITAVKDLIQQRKPGIELSASFTPEINNDANVHYSQDYAVLTSALDRVMPTAFIVDYSATANLGWVKTVTTTALGLTDANCKLSTGLQVTTAVTPSMLTTQITNAVEAGASGLVISRYDRITTDEKWGIISNLYLTIVPVELTSFAADINSGDVNLKWATATEKNNHGFEIEKKPAGGQFRSIGFVEGNGTTSEYHSYAFVDKAPANNKYVYRLKQVDYDGTFAYSQEIEVDLNASTVKSFSLEQNYPNPFNPVTTIRFNLPAESRVTLKVFNMLGEEVLSLLDNQLTEAGTHSVNVNAAGLPSGIYMYRVQAGNEILSRKMILIK